MELVLYNSNISAGFPSPADDYIEGKLDLNKYLISNPPATFFVKAECNSMIRAGIFKGDILIVDKSQKPSHGKIIIAEFDGELLVRRLYQKNGQTILLSENKHYPELKIKDNLQIWGLVTAIIRKI